MSKIKLKIGNVGRGNKKVFAAIAVSALVMVAAITIITSTQAQQPIPHAIYGYVRYANNSAVDNATVVITVINGSNPSDIRGTLMNTTDNTGYYSVDLGNLQEEWENGDNITAYAYIVIGDNTFGGDNFTLADNTTTHQWLNVTINEPSTIKTIGEPKCREGYYVTNETEFNLTATPAPGSDVVVATYYRLWHNGAWTSWIDYSGNFTLNMGEGLYYIEFYSEAYNSTLDEYYDEHVHNQSHYVDDIPPATYAEFGEPVAPVTGPGGMPIIGPDTPLWINASEYGNPFNGSGVREIHYMIYRNTTAPENWELVGEQSVYFENVTNASVELEFDSGCYYEVRWYAVDCVGNRADLHHIQFAVDVKHPSINLDIGDPNYYDNDTNRLWVNCSTPIWVNVTDNGCGGIQAGVKQLIINVSWNETTGNHFEHNYVIVVNDSDDGSTDGEIHYKLNFPEECYHEPEFRAIDYVNNTFAFKKEFFVDCEPPWVNKTIPKIAFLEQTEYNTSVEVNASGNYWQSFPALWSYVDAVDVHICGDFYGNGYSFKAEIKDLHNTIVGETEPFTFEGHYCGWAQLHFTHRVYLEHGKTYFLYLVSDPGVTFYWNASNDNPLDIYYAYVYNNPKYNYDFAFKLEYYPVFFNTTTPYPSHPEYSFWNFTTTHNGLNNTYITSNAFFHIASDDEGCMGGVGLKSVQYRIWSNGVWGPWINYTTPFNISDECKHYVQIKATDLLNQTRITNQTHYVDNSPPELIPPWRIFDAGKHGWFNDSGIYRMRAGYGIWFNFTDMPECNPVGFRSATLYWRYTYTNFTMPVPEEHPANDSDTSGDFVINTPYSIENIGGTYWYVVHLDYPDNSTYIAFTKECMHNITYFYTTTDWLDNDMKSEKKNLTIYVDEQPPEMGDMTIRSHYYYNDTNGHYGNTPDDIIVINDTAGHIRAGAPFFIDASDTHMLRKVCTAQTEHDSDDTLQKGNNITAWPNDAQLFKATCDHINATKLYLFWGGAAKVTVVIHNGSYNGSNALGEASADLTGSGSGWIEFTFSPGIQVEKGQCYYLEAFVGNDSNAVVRWAYNSSDAYEGTTCYGVISHQKYNYTRDWAFQIIANDPNPCDSGLEGIYYGYYYEGEWYPYAPGDGIVDIVEKYNYDLNDFYGHRYWYVYNSTTGVVFNDECQHNFSYWAKDNVCHHTPVYNHTFYVDDSVPEVSMEMPSCYSVQEDVIEKTIWHESFEDGNANDWTIAPLLGSDAWKVENGSYIENMGWSNLVIDGNYALVYDDDAWDNYDSRNASYAISPSIDCSNYDVVYLSFAAELDAFGGDGVLYVNISNDNGATWHNVWLADDDEYGFYTLDISSLAARHTILLNITYDDEVDQWGWGAIIDNITVYYPREHISCNAPIHLHAIDYPVTNGLAVDQEQTNYNYSDAIENISGLYTAQSFVPTVDKLDAVELLLDYHFSDPVHVNVSIYDSGLNLVGYNNLTIVGPIYDQWVQFLFSSINLIPGETYWIAVSAYNASNAYDPNEPVGWRYYDDAYPNGYMIIGGGLDTAHDYAFKTEYYGDVEDTCAAGLEDMYYGYYYNGTWYPGTEERGVINISMYYNDTEIANDFGGHELWYIYNPYAGINFTQQCQHDLYYWAKDNVCHHTIVYERDLYVDNTEPTINISYPSHGYEIENNTSYLRAGANITLYADDMPDNNCSSGTWLYWRYVWNNSGTLEYYPVNFSYFEGFENINRMPPAGWENTTRGWYLSTDSHSGTFGAYANGSYIGWAWLNSSSITLPNVAGNNRIFLIFWQRANLLNRYDAANIFGIINASGFVPLKFFYKDDMSNEWQRVIIDLTPYAGQTIKLAWVYENDYGYGETWRIDDVEVSIWNAIYGYDNVTQNISFNEDCNHTLYYFASDTTCHSTEIHHQTYYVDGTAPDTDYTVITNGIRLPTYDNLVDYTICINDSINLTTNNTGKAPCIYPYTQTYYRWVWIDENGTKHYYPDSSMPDAVNGNTLQPSSYADEIEPYYWMPYTGNIKFTEGCEHWLYFFSKDNLSNTEEPHNISFGVDDKPPVTNLEFQGRSFTVDLNGYTATYINRNTIVWINATDLPNYPICSTGVNYTRYTIWKYNTVLHKWDVLVPWTDTNSPAMPGITIYTENATNTARTIHIRINLTELMGGENYCGKYEIHWYSIDYNGWIEDEHYQDVIIDCSPPDASKEFSSPVVVGYLPGGEMIHWITNHTCIWINGSDDEDWDSGVGEIYYKFVNEAPVLLWQYDPSHPYREPSACFVIDRPDGIYELYHWAVDRVGNVGDYNLTKQHVVLDDSAPSSCVEKIVPYEQRHPPFNITVTNITDHGPLNNGVGVCKVELYYRYSIDNYTWSNWILYATNDSLITHEDGTADDWTLTFNNATRLGYYEFRSIAYDCLGNVEHKGDFTPGCDAMCHVPDIMPPVSVKTYGSPVIELAPDIHVITSDTTIWINITDMPDSINASGVDKLMMSFDGTHYNTITSFDVLQAGSSGSYMVSYHFKPSDYGLGEGSYQMFFYAIDKEGNVENETKQKFIVDDSAPETTITINGNETMPFDITIKANDTAGVKSMTLYYRYSEDGVNWGAWTPYAENDSIIGSVTVVQNGNNITLIPDIQPWIVSFNMPVTPGYYKPGYYQFYVAATDNLNNSKAAPTAGTAPEAACYVPPWKEDLNADGRVNIADMLMVLDHFGESGAPGFIPEDVHADGTIDIGDIIAIGHKWTG